jgi:hypothetical protein
MPRTLSSGEVHSAFQGYRSEGPGPARKTGAPFSGHPRENVLLVAHNLAEEKIEGAGARGDVCSQGWMKLRMFADLVVGLRVVCGGTSIASRKDILRQQVSGNQPDISEAWRNDIYSLFESLPLRQIPRLTLCYY